jgi:hypothetical protein
MREKLHLFTNERRNNLSKRLMWQYVDWLDEVFHPITMVTLTFKDDRVVEEKAWGMFKKWIDAINTEVQGKHYKREWKHSYFGYVVAAEYQSREVIHYHVLIDNWFPWEFASRYWWKWGGFIKIKKIKNVPGAIRYTLKYLMKSGNPPVVWLTKKMWVKENVIKETVNVNAIYQQYLDSPYDGKRKDITSLIRGGKHAELG